MNTPSTHPRTEAANGQVPPLENGDRLTRAEFERRYEAMPHLKKAELVEGVVHMPSPVRQRRHSRPNNHLGAWLAVYEAATPGTESGNNGTTRLDVDNEPQPDGFLFILPECGGQARISEDDYIEGAPELIGEIAASSVSIDLHLKFHVYRRNQVREYIVWRVLDNELDWFINREGQFLRLVPGPEGILRSETFPGLWLDPAALVRGDLARVLAVLRDGLKAPEHAAFVARLGQSS